MQKKILTILVLTSSLFASENKINENSFQCNEKITKLLEQQLKLQEKTHQLQSLQIEIKIQELKEKEARQEALREQQEIEANKPWYEKTWDLLEPNIKNAILRFLIASITGKIINGSIQALDHATGDILVQNGYDQYALYLGTFIAEESIHEYLKKRGTKKVLANPEVQNYLSTLDHLKSKYGTDIAKGEIIGEGSTVIKKARQGQNADNYLKKTAEMWSHTSTESQNTPNIISNN